MSTLWPRKVKERKGNRKRTVSYLTEIWRNLTRLLIMKFQKSIVIDRNIMTGKPVIKGTRIPVELILKLLAQKMDAEKILKQYPRLTKKDIQAAIYYAQEVVSKENIYFLDDREIFKKIQFA